MHQSSKPEAQDGGRTLAGGASAAAGGLDLSLGHVGTQARTAGWWAFCDACHYSLSREAYRAAEAAAGPESDPRCPGCGRMAWLFDWD